MCNTCTALNELGQRTGTKTAVDRGPDPFGAPRAPRDQVTAVNWGQWHGPYALPAERMAICASGKVFVWQRGETRHKRTQDVRCGEGKGIPEMNDRPVHAEYMQKLHI